MSDFLQWIGRFENSKIIALLLFFATFCGILVYVFSNKRRSDRLESYKYIPFTDDDESEDKSESENKRKVDER